MSRQLDDRMYCKMERLVRRLVHEGSTQDAAIRQVVSTVQQTLDAAADDMFAELEATADEHLAGERQMWQEFQAVLRGHSSEALDVYYLTVYGVAEARIGTSTATPPERQPGRTTPSVRSPFFISVDVGSRGRFARHS